MVGYVELLEGYYDHLETVTAERELAVLKTAQAWADRLLQGGPAALAQHDDLAATLRQRIEQVAAFCARIRKTNRAVVQEAIGLRIARRAGESPTRVPPVRASPYALASSVPPVAGHKRKYPPSATQIPPSAAT